MPERGGRLPWEGPLAFLLALLGARPEAVGQLGDDALYLAMARGLARGEGLTLDVLPGAPSSAKFPPLYPALLAPLTGAEGPGPLGIWLVLGLNALLWGLAVHRLLHHLLPALGVPAGRRAAAGLLLATSALAGVLVPTAMSEPLFVLLGVLSLEAALPAAPAPARLALLTLLGLLLPLCRSAGLPLLALGVLLCLLGGRRPAGLALGLGLLLSLGARAVQRGLAGPAQPLLGYYTGYEDHGAIYTEALAAGGVPALLRALLAVAARNAQSGARSLANALSPADLQGGAEVGAAMLLLGALALALALHGLFAHRPTRPLAALVLGQAALHLLWTWPFAPRFWLPVLPLLATGWALAPRERHRLPALLALGLVLLGQLPRLVQDARHHLAAGPGEADLRLERDLDELRAARAAGDRLVAAQAAFWFGQRLELPAVELRALVPARERGLLSFPRAAPGWTGPDPAALEHSLRTLAASAPPGGRLWILALGEATPDPLLQALAAEGRVEALRRGALEVYRLRPHPDASPPADRQEP